MQPATAPAPVAYDSLRPHGWTGRFLATFLWTVAGVYIVAVALCVIANPVDPFDGAIPLLYGRLVAQGQTPNLDFPSFYPPLGAYASAAAFWFRQSVVSVRLVYSGLFVAVLVAFAMVLRAHPGRTRALDPLCVLMAAAAMGLALPYPAFPGIAISVLAVMAYQLSETCNGRWVILVAGVLTGAALLTRVNCGLYAAAPIGADLAFRYLDATTATWRRSIAARAGIFTAAAVATVVAVCAVVFEADTLTAVSAFTIHEQHVMAKVFIPLQVTGPLVCVLAFPFGWWVMRGGEAQCGVKGIIAAGLALAASVVSASAFAHTALASAVVPGVVIGGLLFVHAVGVRLDRREMTWLLYYCCLVHYFVARADFPHFAMLPAGFAFVFCWIGREQDSGSTSALPSPVPVTPTVVALPVIAVAAIALAANGLTFPTYDRFITGMYLIGDACRHPGRADADLVKENSAAPAGWANLYDDPDEWAAARYILSRTGPKDAVFVGSIDHSTVIINHLRLYWLLNRPIAVREFQMMMGVTTQAQVQRSIIADLERRGVAWIVLDRRMMKDAAVSTADRGSRELDEYLAKQYREQTQFGRYSVRVRYGADTLAHAQ